MLGGSVIGQGTYGCAIVPPLLCKGKAREARKDQRGKKVGKLTLDMDAETEVKISKILRKESLWKNYFVLPEVESCEPLPKNRTENWYDCGITAQYKPDQLRQLVSDFGGKSFSSLSSTNLRPGTFNFLFFMKHSLEACALLTLRGVVHYDLHRSNILIDSMGVPRLLDFGMAFDAKEITEDTLNQRWKQYDPKYDSEPPEITVITGMRGSGSQRALSLEVATKDAVLGKPVFKEYEIFFGIDRERLIDSLRAFCVRSKSFVQKDWVTFFQTYWPGLDSFALGAALLNILKTQLTWPSFVDSKEWLKHGDTVMKTLQGMVNIDPSERFDCVEALEISFPDSVVLKHSADWLAARKAQRLE